MNEEYLSTGLQARLSKENKTGYLWPCAICSHHTTVIVPLYVQFKQSSTQKLFHIYKQLRNEGHRFGLSVKKRNLHTMCRSVLI